MDAPNWVTDFESFRRWAHSGVLPEKVRIAYLDGEIWGDFRRGELLSNNEVHSAIGIAIMRTQPPNSIGSLVGPGMFYTNRIANLATQPDGMFYLWSTMRSGRLRMTEPRNGDYMELEGTPDVVFEAVDDTSERKDKELLRHLYWKAEIPEYWLVDARPETPHFDILRRTATGYAPTEPIDGWLASAVLGRDFRLVRKTDPLGDPQFVVETR